MSKFHVWSITSGRWLKNGITTETDDRKEAGEFTLEEAMEICWVVTDGRPLAAMVPISHEPDKTDPRYCYTVPRPERVEEVRSIGFACGVLEGLELTADPKLAAGIKEALKQLRKPIGTLKLK